MLSPRHMTIAFQSQWDCPSLFTGQALKKVTRTTQQIQRHTTQALDSAKLFLQVVQTFCFNVDISVVVEKKLLPLHKVNRSLVEISMCSGEYKLENDYRRRRCETDWLCHLASRLSNEQVVWRKGKETEASKVSGVGRSTRVDSTVSVRV